MESLTIQRETMATVEDLRSFLERGSADLQPAVCRRLEQALMFSVCVGLGDVSRLWICSINCGSRMVGAAILVSEISSIFYSLGPLRLGRSAIDRLRIAGDALLVWSDADPRLAAALEHLLQFLRQDVDKPITLQWASRGGKLEGLARSAAMSKAFIVQDIGEFRPRFWIESSDDFAKYLASLGSSSRQTFRYSLRRLIREMEGQVRLQRFIRVEEIEGFLRDAASVSVHTYQWQELGLGLKNREMVGRRMQLNARLGYLRSYVLYCRDKPVAFIEGYQAGALFVFYQIGYLPEFSKLSAGTVAVLEALRDLMDSEQSPSVFDFLPGVDDYKRRMSNRSAEERTSYLFPRTLKWRLSAMTLGCLGTMTRWAVRVKGFARRRLGRQ